MPALIRPLPEFIGRDRIQSLIGRGGMGEVHKAYDPKLDRLVALKTINSQTEDPDVLNRLYREARACGRLDHPRSIAASRLPPSRNSIAMNPCSSDTS